MNYVFPTSADPFTYGHMDLIQRVLRMSPDTKVTVGIGRNSQKKYALSESERISLVERSCYDYFHFEHPFYNRFAVETYDGLLADYAISKKAVVLRGVRNSQDVEFERVLSDASRSQQSYETLLMFCDQQKSHISSSATKLLLAEWGFIHEFVPLHTKQYLEEKIHGVHLFGVTGEIGAGKSYFCRNAVHALQSEGYTAKHIDLDVLAKRARDLAGLSMTKSDVDYFFSNEHYRATVVSQLKPYLFSELRNELRKPDTKGFVFIEGALIAEYGFESIVNNNVILMRNQKNQDVALKNRGYSDGDIVARKKAQLSFDEKLELLHRPIVVSEDYDYTDVFRFLNSYVVYRG
jgi:pantetheine-phosphate adenylyltransferase